MAASTWAASAAALARAASAAWSSSSACRDTDRSASSRPSRVTCSWPAALSSAALAPGAAPCQAPGRCGGSACGGPLPGLLLAHPGLGESPAGPVGLGQRGSHLGRAGGGGQLGPPVLQVRLCRGQPVAGVQGVLPAPLPVG